MPRMIVPKHVSLSFTKGFRDMAGSTDPVARNGAERVFSLQAILMGELESNSDIPRWLGKKTRPDEELWSGQACTDRLTALREASRVEFHFDADESSGSLWVTMVIFYPGRGHNRRFSFWIMMDVGGTALESANTSYDL